MKLNIVCAVALATAIIVTITVLLVLTSLRSEKLELRLERAQLEYATSIAHLQYIVLLNTKRQLHLEHVFENSEGFRLTLKQIKAYNMKMKTQWVSLPRHKQNAIGGE